MAYDQRIGAGALYRLDLDGSMCVVLPYIVYRVSANTLRSRLRRCPPWQLPTDYAPSSGSSGTSVSAFSLTMAIATPCWYHKPPPRGCQTISPARSFDLHPAASSSRRSASSSTGFAVGSSSHDSLELLTLPPSVASSPLHAQSRSARLSCAPLVGPY